MVFSKNLKIVLILLTEIFLEHVRTELAKEKSASQHLKDYAELVFPCNGNCSKQISSNVGSKKLFLKNILQNLKHDEVHSNIHAASGRDLCNIKNMEISIIIENCGRVLLNTTKCEGYCKSKSTIIPNTELQKNSCYSCKVLEFEFVTYNNIKCVDGTLTSLTLKTVKSCTCFKRSEYVNLINRRERKKSFLENFSS